MWTIFEWFMSITVVQSFFFPRGEIPGYRHTQRVQEIHLSTLLVKGERKGERSGYRQNPVISIVQAADRHNPYSKREKGTGTVQSHMVGGKAQSGDKQRPHPAGRDPHPQGRQPGHQGEWASVKETSRTQRLQPVH